MQETLDNILKAINKMACTIDEHRQTNENNLNYAKSVWTLAQAYKALKDSSRNDDKKQHSPS